MKKRSIFLVIAVLAIIGSLVLIYIGTKKKAGFIKTAGIIEGTEVNLSPEVPGIISYMCCNEGDHIKQGDVAFELESKDIKALVHQAEAGVSKAKAGITVSESAVEGSRAEIKSAEADMKAAAANKEKTRVQMELAK
jgi:HlyD family secretion protein